MADVDFAAVAQRARNAGKSVEQFVRECFEAVPSLSVASMPVAPSTVSSTISAARTQVGVKTAPTGSSATPAAADEAARDDLVIGMLRAAILDRPAERAVWLAKIQAFDAARQKPTTATATRVSVDTWVPTQADALRELVMGLQAAWSLGARQALTQIVQRAQRTFFWTTEAAGAALEQMANFLFRLVGAVMQRFALTAQAIAPIFCAVALEVGVIVIVVVVILVAVFAFAAVGGAAFVLLVAAAAGMAAIAAALAQAFASGIPVDAIVRAGAQMRRTAEEWGALVCEAWRLAFSKPAVADLVRALVQRLQATAQRVAYWLKAKCALTLDAIADAIIANFGRDATELARALQAAQAKAGEIASLLKSKLSAGASAIAQALKDVGFDATAVAAALRNAAFSAADAAMALLQKFGLDATGIARALTRAQYAAQDVIGALVQVCRVGIATAMSIVASVG